MSDRALPSYLLAFCVVALVNAIFLSISPLPVGGIATRAAHHFFDAGHLVAIGLVVELSVVAYRRWGPARPAFAYVLIGVVSIGLGLLRLPDDVVGLVNALGVPSTEEAASVASATVSLALPAGVRLGVAVAGTRLYALGVALGLTLAVLNHLLLPGRYPGLHDLAVATGAALAGAASSGLQWQVRPERRSLARAARVGLAVFAAASFFTPRSQRVRLEMSRTDGVLGVTLLSLFPIAEPSPGVIPTNEWFQRRDGAPDVLPSQPPIVGSDTIVLLITMDSVRGELLTDPEHAGALRRLHEIAGESTHFQQARSVAASTVPAFASVFTGKHGFQLKWRRDSPGIRHEKVRELIRPDPSVHFPELLRNAGVRTVTFASFPPLLPGAGVLRGFDEGTIVEQARQPSALAKPMMNAVISRVEQGVEGPMFLFVHLMDPHHPYNSAGKLAPFDGYVAETAVCSNEIGRLVDVLKKRRLWQRTVLIVAADHGEGFNEHQGHATHNTALYEEILRVPLIIRVPGQPGRVVDRPVSLIDIGPTILDLFQVPTPGAFMGQSLVPFLRGDDADLSRPIVASLRGSSAMFELSRKIIVNFETGMIELYDLERDPDETDNLADSGDGGMVARLMALRRAHSPP